MKIKKSELTTQKLHELGYRASYGYMLPNMVEAMQADGTLVEREFDPNKRKLTVTAYMKDEPKRVYASMYRDMTPEEIERYTPKDFGNRRSGDWRKECRSDCE